ncbi:dihydrofolate reductase family protein [Microbacterium sp. NPDC057650]|uniref:dihydrofolate reductase family protein n=1 Tax=unclassified Microbacterium TaxID=2609290 RepID=UPI0036725DDC
MTSKLVYTGFLTVDGIVDSPGSSREGHPGGGWVFDTPFLPEAYSLKGEELGETTALMFGRRSYDAFSAVWPGSDDHADYRDLPKYVVSTSIRDEDLVSGWGPQHILRSTEDVARLKESVDGGIFIHGSAELATRLGEADLIDQYNLLMFPYLLGGGKSVFRSDELGRRNLKLRESDVYENGVVKLVYDVQR